MSASFVQRTNSRGAKRILPTFRRLVDHAQKANRTYQQGLPPAPHQLPRFASMKVVNFQSNEK
uniref:Uncharacterized protein n=1 Tax=Parascaris equorum TaxID=6256 RepID=A0A914RGE9_PAREQ